MDTSRKFADRFIPAFPMAMFLFILMQYSRFSIGFKEQTGIFFFGPGCLERYVHDPAILSRIVGDFLTRFFMIEWLGVVICMVMLALLWWGLDRFMRLRGAKDGSRFLAAVPVAIECVFMAYPNYPLSSTVGLVLAVWTAAICSGIGKNSVRMAVLAVCFPVLYILLGAPAVVFVLLVMLTFKNYRRRVLICSSTALVVGGMGLLYNLSRSGAFLFPLVDGYISPNVLFVAFSYWFIIPACTSLAEFEMKPAVKYAIVLASVGIVYAGKPGKDIEYSIEIGTHAYYGDWEKVREMGRQNRGNRYGLYFYNLSYAREGNLPDNLLSIRQHLLSDGLFLSVNRGESYLSSFYWPMALVEIGDFAQANDAALLGQTVMPGAYSSRMMRTLAEIAVASGDYGVAKKYLDMLSRTPGHRTWAANLLQKINENDIPERYLIWRSRAVESGDRLYPQGDIRSSLELISDSNPLNKVAADYLMCSCLLKKNVNTFISMYEKWYLGILDRFVEVPKIYEQALLVNVDSNESLEETVLKYSISRETVDRYMEFLQDQIKADGKLSVLESKYRDTYWYYIMSTNLVQNENK